MGGKTELAFNRNLAHFFSQYKYIFKRVNYEPELFAHIFDGFFTAFFTTWIPLQISSLVITYKLLSFWATTRKTSDSGELPFILKKIIFALSLYY